MNISSVSHFRNYSSPLPVQANQQRLSFGAMVRVEDSKRTETLQGLDKKIKSGEALSETERLLLIRYMPDVYEVIFKIKG